MVATSNAIAKIAAVLAGLALVATSFASAVPAKAAMTSAEMQAMIASLQAQLAALQGGSSSASATFTMNLMVGSKGADVTALQNWLIKQGMSIPAGATGTFGPQTKAALAAWQAANGVSPASGFFGPITRAKVNAMAGGSMTGGSMGGSTSSTSGITTLGAEGSINIEKESAGLKTTIYEGDTQAKILGVRIEAKDSDVNFSRVRVNLGTTTDVYNRQFSKVYLMDDAGTVLASRDLNSSTVTRVSGSPTTYYVTLAGFNSLIKKNMKRSYYIAVDAYPSISSTYRTGTYSISFYLDDAIRVTDGAGLDQYSSGAQNITQSFTISQSLSDSALLTVSTDPSVRKATTIVANQGANNNEIDKAEIGSFRLLAEKDDVLLRDINVTVASSTVSGGTLQTLYLFDGATQIGTASAVSPAGTLFQFTSINQTLTRDTYKTYTIKADFRNVTSGKSWTVGAIAVQSAESKMSGKTLANSTLASGGGETMAVVANGVTVTLSTPTISITAPKNQNGSTTDAHISSVFNLTLTAIGSDATFVTPASSFTFALLKNGVATTSTLATRTVFYPATQPTGTTNYTATNFVLPRNATVVIPVTFKVDANDAAAVAADLTSGDYSVRLNTVTYNANGATTTNDYSTNVNYVTPSVTRP